MPSDVLLTIKTNPSAHDFEPAINLLNKVFSKFDTDRKPYTAQTSHEKTCTQKDTLIIEASINNELFGFAICYERLPNFLHLWQLGVDENYRGQRIATKIYEAVELFAQEHQYQGVTLNTFNRFSSNLKLAIKRNYQIYDLDKTNPDDPKILLKLEFNNH